MKTTLKLAGALIIALCITSASGAEVQANCDAGAGTVGESPCPFRAMDLDRLMAGDCCMGGGATECTQVELTVAEELMAAQLREVGSALRLSADGARLLTSLHAAQVAWEGYREAQCTMMMIPEAGEPSEYAALRERCRFEFTVERILDLAELQEKIEASVPRLTQLY